MVKQKSGMTLIELVITIAILGVLSVGALVYIFSHKAVYLETAAEKTKADIEYARSLAMTKKGIVFGVYFDQTANSYTVYENNIATPVQDPLTKSNLIEDFTKFPDVEISGSNYTVEFDSRGRPTTGAGGAVQLTDGSRTKTISVLIETGKVMLQ